MSKRRRVTRRSTTTYRDRGRAKGGLCSSDVYGYRIASDSFEALMISQGDYHDAIAIIGMGCRFPGASNPAAFWRLLFDGKDAISEVPSDRWDIDEYYDRDPLAPGKMNTRWGGFLDRVDEFDPFFFGISPREAACMDPQQRLLLQVAWEALEDGGQLVDHLAGTPVGIFLGLSSYD